VSAGTDRPTLSSRQSSAVDARGTVLVDAGAGSGKTTVLVERYVRALTERNLQPSQILAVTFTNRAAGELRERVRGRLRGEGRDDLVGSVESGWIGTIHGACRRILQEEGAAIGVAGTLRVAGPIEAILLRDRAFDAALRDTVAAHGDAGLELAAAYGRERLRRIATDLLLGARLRGIVPAAPALTGDAGALEAAVDLLRVAATEETEQTGESDAAERRRRAAADLLAVLARDPSPAELADLSPYRSVGPSAYKEVVLAVELAARDLDAAMVRDPLDDLLGRYAERYEAVKEAAGALDQDDLLIRTHDLLERDAGAATRLQERFREILVDEFQDTDGLQVRIIERLRGPDVPLFLVGDEQQSIYGFRGADVEVFRRARSETADDPTATTLALPENRRSRPTLVAAVNALFLRDAAFAHRPLEAVREDQSASAALEVVIGVGERIDDGRAREAAAIAQRIRRLVDEEGYRPGDVALLFRSGSRARLYEQALRDEGLATVASTGRGFLRRQPVADVIALLRVLWNRYDDLALLTCLASPMAGVSNDGLALISAATEWEVVEALDRIGEIGLDHADARAATGLRDALARLRARVGRLGLADLVAAAIAETGYDIATLALPDGVERMANLDKLVRVARDFQEAQGPDLPGFVRAIESGRLDGELRAEGVVASEDDDAIRLMTIHQAKGLEFPVVVFADTAFGRPADPAVAIVAPDGRVGVVVPAASGSLQPTRALLALREERAEAERAEMVRLAYVACTRARDLLVIGGARGGRAASGTILRWLDECLGDLDTTTPGTRVEDLDGVAVRVSVVDELPRASVAPDVGASDASHPPPGEQLALVVDEPVSAATSDPVPGPLAALPESGARIAPTLSYSALALYARCPYRFRLERIGGLPAEPADGNAAVGRAVHRAIEVGSAVDPAALLREADPQAGPAAEATVRAALERYERSPLARRLDGGPDVRHEQPFAFLVGDVVIAGRYDLTAEMGGSLVIGDVKVGSLAGRRAEERRDRDYAIQEAIYALAALEGGYDEVTVIYQWVGDDEAAAQCAERTFGSTDLDGLRARVAELVAGATDGPWTPRPAPATCRDCPALGMLCAGTEGGDRGAAGYASESP
jgi:ATP-dependent helicase/nuclease subunit A